MLKGGRVASLSGPEIYQHLQEDLHVEITAFAPPAEAHARIQSQAMMHHARIQSQATMHRDGDETRVCYVADPRPRLLPETGIRVNNTSQLQSNKFIG